MALFVVGHRLAGPRQSPPVQKRCLQWFAEAVGAWSVVTGKPAKYCVMTVDGQKCGLPHEFGSTGFGVAHSAKVAAELMGMKIKGAKVAIHGFGNVGTFTYTHLTKMGAKVIAIADKDGAVFVPGGFNAQKIAQLIRAKKTIRDYVGGKKIRPEDFWRIPVDILIPASVTDVINNSNKKHIKAKLIVEAGNIPMRENIEDELFRKGIMFVPDFVANAGGVISSYAEYRGYSPEKMFRLVEDKIVAATRAVIGESLRRKKNPRQVAMELARKRVEAAMAKRKTAFDK